MDFLTFQVYPRANSFFQCKSERVLNGRFHKQITMGRNSSAPPTQTFQCFVRKTKSYRKMKNHKFTSYKFTNYSNQLGRLLRNSSRKLNSTSLFSSPVWKPTKMFERTGQQRYQQKWLKAKTKIRT